MTDEEVMFRVPLTEPFLELLELEADRSDQTAEELAQTLLWVGVDTRIRDELAWVTVDTEVEIPEPLYRRLELKQEHGRLIGSNTSLEERLFNFVGWKPTWLVDGDPIGEE